MLIRNLWKLTAGYLGNKEEESIDKMALDNVREVEKLSNVMLQYIKMMKWPRRRKTQRNLGMEVEKDTVPNENEI